MSFIRLQLRHDTAANWTSEDPTLEAAEFGVETDTGKFKIGDGSTAWTSLPYASGGLADGDYGDVTVSGSGTVITIKNGAVTYAKIQDVSATSRVLGRITSGAGDVEELTGANVRTIAGLATTDSPEFTGINLGHASDTTLTRTGAGDIAVEGNAVYRAGGTDVPVADGGTGASTAAGARTNLGLGTAAVENTGTSGATVPLLNGNNTHSGKLDLTGGGDLTPAATPSTTAIGYLGAPQMSDQDDYTLVMADAGKHYYHVSATPHTLTIPANASVAFPIGTVIAIVNESGAGALTLAITTDTLRWGSSTGSRTLAANATATLLKVTSTVWRLTGDGIS